LNLALLSFLGIPVIAGMTTNRLSLVIVLILLATLLHKLRMKYDPRLVWIVIIYYLFILSLYAELSVDLILALQFVTAAASLIFLLFLRNYIGQLNSFSLAIILVFILGLVFFNEMMLGPVIGMSRLDVLYWQRETGFFFGINKYLLALFMINAVLLFSNNEHHLLNKIFPLVYFCAALFLGSKTHLILSLLSLVVLFKKHARLNIKSAALIALLVVGMVLGFEVLLELFEKNFSHRFSNIILRFDETPRGIILSAFLSCLSESEFLYGNQIQECIKNEVSDFDNSFFFVIASGGLVSLILFLILISLVLFVFQKSNIPTSSRIYMMFSYLTLLSVDVLVAKSFLFFPLLVYLLNIRPVSRAQLETS
jgi:hypothetical protein